MPGWKELKSGGLGSDGPSGPSGPSGPTGPTGPIGSHPSAFARAYQSGAQGLNNGIVTLVELDTESYDVGGNFDIANYKYVAPANGYYLCCFQVGFVSIVASKAYSVYLCEDTYATGTIHADIKQHSSGSIEDIAIGGAQILYFAAGVDIQLYAKSESGNNNVGIKFNDDWTFLSICRIA